MKTKLLFPIAILLGAYTMQAQVWDENTDGDLSNDNTTPSGAFVLEEGDNLIIADQQGNPSDVDYFTVTIPTGFSLESIFVEEYAAADPTNLGFIGIQEGSVFTTDASSTTAADLLGGTTYGENFLDFNLLASMGILEGAEGFTGYLSAGTYTIWLNQTGDNSEVTLNFEVYPEDNDTYIWEEDFDPDLSDDHLSPTALFTLASGNNFLYAMQQGDAPEDIDYFTFTVPSGLELKEIILEEFESGVSGNIAFIGIVEGTSLPNDAPSTVSQDLLGGTSYSINDLGTDLMPGMGDLANAIGFVGALPEGTYTIWLDQISDPSSIELNFVTDQSLSINDNIFSENDVQLFPNPANQSFSLNSPSPIKNIKIYDTLGRLVLEENANGTLTKNINSSTFKSGLYIVQVQTNNAILSKRLMKQ